MQGQRSTVGSLPEAFTFDHGSTSTNAGLDPQICWNNVRNSGNNRLLDRVVSPNDSIPYLNSTSQDGQNPSGWNVAESSSSGLQNQVNSHERKAEHVRSSASVCAGLGSNSGEQRYEPPNVFSPNNVNVTLNNNQIAYGPFSLPNSSSDTVTQDLNINPRVGEHGVDKGKVSGSPNVYKSGGIEIGRMVSTNCSSDPFGISSGSGESMVEENDRPGCSLEGRRISCKRKALEGHVGQSSLSGSSSYLQHAESSAWHVPARFNACSNANISTPPELVGSSPSQQMTPRLALGVGGAPSETPLALNEPGNAEISRRNFRVRINPSQQEDSIFSARSVVGHSNFPVPHHSSRFLPINGPLDLTAQMEDNQNPPMQSVAPQVPPSRQNLQRSRWNGGSSSRVGNSSGSVIGGEADEPQNIEFNSTSMPRNILEHSAFLPASELRNSAQDQTNWGLMGGNLSFAGSVASTSRAGSSSGIHPLSAHSFVPRRTPTQFPRRLSEFMRRSMMASAASESGGNSSSNVPRRSGPSLSREMPLSSGAGSQGNHLSRSRSATLLERQHDGASGIPRAFRTLPGAGDGRSRLVSEIRNMVDIMRRGEALGIEDVMVLDQSVFFGMADLHDRHREMRLDVDNMSYEELLALEERIGYVNTGLSDEAIINRLKQRKYFSIAIGAHEVEPCCVCQEEYNDGEDLGVLECGHDFHASCIKKWLAHKNLCPVCKTTALVT